MILFENVTKKYGSTTVLDKVNLHIKDGEFVSIIGPSGAGKSTLALALIGAEKISSGKILVDGFEVNSMKERELQFYRRKIGVVFQDYKLLEQKNVVENVAFALEVCGYSKADTTKRVHEVLETVGLQKHHRHFPRHLSGGEKQRTAIARALAHNPALIVADEPTGNLDPKTAREIVELFLKINQTGTTVLLTTHNKDMVNAVQRRVITLLAGRVASDRIGNYEEFNL